MTVSKKGRFYHYRFMLDGERYQGSTKETNPGKARQFESALMTKLRDGGRNPHIRKAPLLSEFAPVFLKHIDKQAEAKNLAENTRKCYHNGCRLLSVTPIWGLRLDRIGRPEASELSFPHSAYNANRALRTLRRILSHAEECRILRAAPRIDLRKEHGRDRTIEPWMESLILEHASSVLRDVFTVMMDCGMRPEEVGRMEWKNIRWEENTVLVPHGKSLKARRHVGLTERMREVFEGAKKRNIKRKRADSPYVFPSRGKSGHIGSFSKLWERTIQRAKKYREIPEEIVLYSARHTFATNFLRNGGDIGTLSRLMGHSDIRTTQRYLHLVEAGSTALIMDKHNERKLRLVKSA